MTRGELPTELTALLKFLLLSYFADQNMSAIEHPGFRSFEGQRAQMERCLELSTIEEAGNRAHPYLNERSKAAIKNAKDKIAVLDNLIKIYGPRPVKNENFLATVYGDRDPYYDGDICLKLKDEYQLELYPYSHFGTQCFASIEGLKSKLYVPDGNGKYRFWRRMN